MKYRKIKRTGWDVSTLSFGCMRFADEESAVKAVHRAMQVGVNYFDVAPMYGGGTAEKYLGLALKGHRKGNIVTAKSSPGNGGDGVQENYDPATGFGVRSYDDTRRQIDRSMDILGVDHLDAYQLWACHGEGVYDEAIKPGGFMEAVRAARKEGLFDYVGITSHDNAKNLIRYLSSGDFDMVTIPFHARDISRLEAVKYCAANGIGVVAMNPLGGGGLTKKSVVFNKAAGDVGAETMVEAALRFVLSFDGITTALSGITYDWQADGNAAAVDRGDLTGDGRELLQTRVQEIFQNVKYFCTACGYCGECPSGIDIPGTIDLYNSIKMPGTREDALIRLRQSEADPASCTSCGMCVESCPNNIPIPELMEAAVVEFGALNA